MIDDYIFGNFLYNKINNKQDKPKYNFKIQVISYQIMHLYIEYYIIIVFEYLQNKGNY